MSETTSATLRVVVDGDRHALPAGLSVLDALRFIGIDVPTLCHDDRLVPSGACRLCLVRISGLSTTDAGLHDKADRRYGDLDSYA